MGSGRPYVLLLDLLVSQKARLVMNCIQQRNPGAGFQTSHSRFCICEEDATHHINVGYACGNYCQRCVERVAKEHRGSVVEKGIFVPMEQ